MKIALDPRKAPKWMLEGACVNEDTRECEFFPTKGQSSTSARIVCSNCPVRTECLDYALVFDMEGIWGGLTQKERNRMYSREIREMVRDEYFDAA